MAPLTCLGTVGGEATVSRVLRLPVQVRESPQDTVRSVATCAGDVAASCPQDPRDSVPSVGVSTQQPGKEETHTRPVCTLLGLRLCSRDQFKGFI